MGKPETGRVQGDWTAVYPQDSIGERLWSGHSSYPYWTDEETEAQSSHRIHTASECGCSQPGAWLHVLNYHLRVGLWEESEQGALQMSGHCVGWKDERWVGRLLLLGSLTAFKCWAARSEFSNKTTVNWLQGNYRHPSIYRASQILCSLQTEVLRHLCVKQVCLATFPIAFAHFVSLGHILKIISLYQASLLLLSYGNLWPVIFDVTIAKRGWLTEGSDDG